MQKRHNSSALAVELRFICIEASECSVIHLGPLALWRTEKTDGKPTCHAAWDQYKAAILPV